MKIVVTSSSFSKNATLKQELEQYFEDVLFNKTGDVLSGDVLLDYIQDADGVIAGLDDLNRTVLSNCSQLKVISKYGVGLDNIDLDFCSSQGIHVCSLPGINKRSVSEMVLAFMISLLRNLYSTSLSLKTGKWDKNGGVQLSGKTIGLIGFGHIGQDLLTLLHPFNCRILVNDIKDFSDYPHNKQIEFVSKEVLYQQSDLVTLHVPLTPLTHHMVGSDELRLMKPTSFLINTSRGNVVCQQSLKRALQDGEILGAALDVYEIEPPTDILFLSLPNLFCTPHIGGNASEAVLAMGRAAISNLKSRLLDLNS